MNINELKYPLLLDGGLSNQLERQGCDLNHPLWSAKLLNENPEKIVEAHLAYLNAGAQCITTASYQASIPGFLELNHSRDVAEELLLKSIHLAEVAVKKFLISSPSSNKPLIAASIGPYGAYLADGSEYRGDYGISYDDLTEFHLPRIKLLDASKADFFACETIPSFKEAKVLADIMRHTQKPAWISFSCKDGIHINDGTPIQTCAAFLSDHPNIFALGINCTAPKHVSSLIKLLKSTAGGKKIVVYPNSGEDYHVENKSWNRLPNQQKHELLIQEWVELGVDIIGGCCRVNPEQINRISQLLVKGQNSLC